MDRILSAIARRVDWVPVGERWCRVSIMGHAMAEEQLSEQTAEKMENLTVLLMIPGNPGNEGFYADFGKRLLANLINRDQQKGLEGRQYLFYTVSHLNHIHLPVELQARSHKTMKASDRYLLHQQVDHKMAFVREHLPRASRVILLGHSIGTYMMLRILPQMIAEGFKVERAIGLFPTIEHMALTPNGKRLDRTLAKFAVSLNLGFSSAVPDCIRESAAELLYSHVFRNIVHMSHDELEHVKELDTSLLTHADLVYLLYGTTDGWCPVEFGESMRARLDEGHVIMDDQKCEHAFVIRDGHIVAEKLLEIID